MLLLDDATAERLKEYLRLKSDAGSILEMLDQPAAEPRVVINITGGVMQGSSGNMPVAVYCLDFDCNDDKGVEIEGSLAWAYEQCCVFDPAFVEHVIQQLDLADA